MWSMIQIDGSLSLLALILTSSLGCFGSILLAVWLGPLCEKILNQNLKRNGLYEIVWLRAVSEIFGHLIWLYFMTMAIYLAGISIYILSLMVAR